MRRSPLANVVPLLLPLLLLGCNPKESQVYRDLEKTWKDESQKSADLQKKVADLEKKVADLEAEKTGLEDRVKAGEDNLAAKQLDLRAAQDQVNQLQALNDELSRSKKKLEQAKEELEKKSNEYAQLANSLKADIDAGKVELSELRGKMTVKMKDKILFASGSATLGKDGKEALAKVAEALKGLKGKVIRVEGHTDNLPTTAGGPFPTNWELSNARALAVVRFLQEKGVDPTLLGAAGYGEFQPIASNDTPEGRSLNRRIEIVLASADAPPAPLPAPADASAKPR